MGVYKSRGTTAQPNKSALADQVGDMGTVMSASGTNAPVRYGPELRAQAPSDRAPGADARTVGGHSPRDAIALEPLLDVDTLEARVRGDMHARAESARRSARAT
jgi:hypothetical protein